MSQKTSSKAKWLVILGLLLVPALFCGIQLISLANEETVLATQVEQGFEQREASFDNLFKVIAQKGQVALKNDSSFRQNVAIIMSARKDAGDVFMKWVQESNPNANYAEVSALYKDLSRAIEAKRDGFFNEEKRLQDLVMRHRQLLRTFPSGIILKSVLGRKEFTYKPITSDRTEQVMETGKDNDINVF